MEPIRSPTLWPQLGIGRVMIGIAALAVVIGLALYETKAFVLLLFLGINVGVYHITRTPHSFGRREPRHRPRRRFRFSIWQIMVVVVFAAGCSIFARMNPVAGILAFVLFGMAALGVITIVRVGPGDRQRGEIVFGLSKKERWAKIQSQPFPPEWSWIMARNVPIYDRLSELDKAELRGLIQVFLAEKVFEGCVGLEITDEIKVTIAAQACLLLLRRETDVYPNLITILVYPSAYVSNMPQHGPHGLVTEGPQGRLGEAWTSGVVVLSWDDVLSGAADVRDGHNVVFHEFAHQLDQEDGSPDGAPILPRRNLYSAWARVLGAEYDELRKAAETGKKSVLDTYGATEPAEFFAVATEAFFEKPVQLKKKHPELYEELKLYYGQDPEVDFAAPTSRPKP
jgi:MtfA peptidase